MRVLRGWSVLQRCSVLQRWSVPRGRNGLQERGERSGLPGNRLHGRGQRASVRRGLQRQVRLATLRLAVFLLILTVGWLLAGGVSFIEAAYPSEQPITYIIPFDPGGQSDLEARRQQPLLEALLGTDVIISYKPGGGGSVGWSELVQARPDGYTLAGNNVPHIILQPLLREDPGYQTFDMEPVALFQTTPIGLAVHKDAPWQTLEEFIAAAHASPGAITVGGSGTHSGHHIAHLQFEALTGARLTYVPFTGAAPQVAAFLGRHVAAIFGNSSDLVQHADNIRVLAFGGDERFPLLPDTPTFKELGLDMSPSIDRGVAVPKGTPPERIAVLEEAFRDIVNREEVRQQMIAEGFVPANLGAQEFRSYLEAKEQEYSTLLKELGLAR